MFSEREVLGLQAEKHELILAESIAGPEAYNLFLIHKKAYELAARLGHGLRVLDLGCNTGYGTSLIAREAASVTGLDVSPRAVEEGRRRHPQLDLRTGDGRSLPFADGSFDLVVSLQVIEHVADPDRYLNEIKRVLTPAGRLVLTTPNAALRLAPGMRPWNGFHVREYRAAELEALLRRHFADPLIKGLFADEPQYGIEVRRLARLRERGRRRQSKWYRLKQALASAGADGAGDAGDAAQAPPPDPQAASTAAFHYRAGCHEGALDLLAICRGKR